jgi:hypothetical protein
MDTREYNTVRMLAGKLPLFGWQMNGWIYTKGCEHTAWNKTTACLFPEEESIHDSSSLLFWGSSLTQSPIL